MSGSHLRRWKAASQPALFQPVYQFDVELAHVKARNILAHQVNHVAVRAASEAVEVIAVELQARRPVCVERATYEAGLHGAVALRGLYG